MRCMYIVCTYIPKVRQTFGGHMSSTILFLTVKKMFSFVSHVFMGPIEWLLLIGTPAVCFNYPVYMSRKIRKFRTDKFDT